MDFHKNDFQSQNFQLVVEENKFPANLQSFAPSKFGFDEHLEFHTLVETEALLDIQGRRHIWIEDFSPVGSAIDYSSSVAESCSVTRHNNVWLEATSSESVEMLLKSVGEDEMIDQKSIIMDSRADDGLHGMDDLVEFHLIKDEVHHLTLRDCSSADPGLPQDICEKTSSGLSEDSMFLSQIQGCNGSVFSENSDGLLEAIAYPAKSLNDNEKACGKIFGKEEHMCSLAWKKDSKFENDSRERCSEVILKITGAIDGCKTAGFMMQHSPEEDDDVHMRETSSIKSPTMSFMHGGGKLNEIAEENQEHEGKYTNNNSSNSENTALLLRESYASSIVNYETQSAETNGYKYLNNLIHNNSETVVVYNVTEDMDVDRPEAKLDTVEGSASDDSSAPAVVSDVELNISTSSCKSFVYDVGTSKVDASEANDVRHDVSVEKKASITDNFLDRFNSDELSGVRKKAQGLSSVDCNPAEMLSFDDTSAEKLAREELISDPVSLGIQKSVNFHWPNSDDTVDMDVVVQQEKPLTEASPASSIIHFNVKNLEVSGVSTSLLVSGKASNMDLASFSEKTKDISPEEQSQYYSGSQFAAEDKSKGSQLSQEIVDVSSTMKLKEDPLSRLDGSDYLDSKDVNLAKKEVEPSSNLGAPYSVDSEDNTMNMSRTERGSNLKKSTFKGLDTASACVEGVSLNNSTESDPFTIAEPSIPVQSTDCTPCQNEVSFSNGETFGNGRPLQVGRIDITLSSCTEEKDNKIQLSGALTHGSKEANLVVSDEVLKSRVNGASSICTGSNAESQPLEDGGLTFEVPSSGDLPYKDAAGKEKSFPSLQFTETSQMPKEMSPRWPEEGKLLYVSTKTPDEEKNGDASRASSEKDTASELKNNKETQALKQSSEVATTSSSATPYTDGTLSNDIHLNEMREPSYLDSNTAKTSSSSTVQTSSVPDLNSSISSLTLFSQPFTDLQQVQLRAQIFVYGALISGIPPDEAYMVSAFGGTDGGLSLWESAWRATVDRLQNQKSPIGDFENFYSSQPVIGVPEQVTRGNAVQSNAPDTSASKSLGTVVSSTLPLSSPLWSISSGDGHHTYFSRSTSRGCNQTSTPLFPDQSSLSRQHAGVNSPWLSQSPRPGAWLISSQGSARDCTGQYSAIPASETIRVVLPRDSSGSLSPTLQVAPPTALLSTTSSSTTTVAPVFQMETAKKVPNSGAKRNTPSYQKTRKRKKDSATEQASLPVLHTSKETASVASVVKSLPTPSQKLALSSILPGRITRGALFPSSTQKIFPDHSGIIAGNNTEHRVILSEETCNRLELAKLQADDASILAASAVKHSQTIWTQLAAQKNAGLVSEVEGKIASAAVAAAAAASVAKVAAAAAKVASNAALQAKVMFDEAINSDKLVNTNQNVENGLPDVGKKLAGLTPVSILEGRENVHGSGAVITAAREAVRRRLEAASAATKRAENLDAIVKAAELAAEAVAQAGTIITMGDPLPFRLSDLVDNGPEDFWKSQYNTSTKLAKTSSLHGGEPVSRVDHGRSTKQFDEWLSTIKETEMSTDVGGISSLNESHLQLEALNKGILPNLGHERANSASSSNIQKGSLVEIMSNEGCRSGAWFSARVLEVKDNNAYVRYNDVLSNGGQLKEWLTLENEGDQAPRIRIAHSTGTVKYEGIRKRRREHLASYIWKIGDHVDAWIRDGWWEGIVTEKSFGDETKVTVHFPARGDKQVVHVWDLRPSLIWKDGQWTDLSHPRKESLKQHEHDTPEGKRQRLCRIDSTGIRNQLKNVSHGEHSKVESRLQGLSAKDRNFSVGKHVGVESTTDAPKIKRTALQKEGSRVIFGVPRPGKKRKFIEVSKHYVGNKSEKISDGSDSIKFAKYLMPQAAHHSRNSKVDSKRKKTVESKPMGGAKAERPHNLLTRSQADKDNSSLTMENGKIIHGCHTNFTSSCSGDGHGLETSQPESSMQLAAIVHSTTKKNASGCETEFTSKNKNTVGVSTEGDEKGPESPGEVAHEVMETRRSNRRIQPTSRLLEGLQSSLAISKIPNVSHERKFNRGGSSSRGNAHG